mmetsp:Transcript_15514/g.44145  ORF Transcript_15514/g.44145 Transcript_15514/m.44145 type:complete len:264 (-) Transcript_15514:43-834(-)|eukprot:CAMPEP_0170263998 /NCGR_PEP_ID=MMETSP0116_2-20130129/31890_1 /TAXON_ID=400756 /ORGANISM="Durinskia baltica, Strain CSIRO CS-38" /LENGTH=263 /DNA_ID=CAMNT_0010515083 /DNA_START=59 /DNA_END=850 /DNA_ORIENTATION=+
MPLDQSLLPAPPNPRKRHLEDTLSDWVWRDWALCCLSRRYKISAEEKSALEDLRARHCNMPFNASSPETNWTLLAIWNSAFPEDPMEAADNGRRWRLLGFQSDNPRTDVRAGRFALDQLHYLASTYPERFRTLRKQAGEKELDYPLAISCFNLSHMAVVYFDLCESETVSPVAGASQAGRAQMQNFARLCARSPHGPRAVLDELFCALTSLFHDTWKNMRVGTNCTLMELPKALRVVFDANHAFWSEPRDQVAELQRLGAPAH